MSTTPSAPAISWRPMTNPDQNPELHLTNGLLPQNPRIRGNQNWWTDALSDIVEEPAQKQALDNGRRYMRKGQVAQIELAHGRLEGRVQGSAEKPYRVRMGIPTIELEQWEQVITNLLDRLDSVAELMADIMPRDIEKFFEPTGARLMPENLNDWEITCTCDDETPCKHAMAVLMLFLDRFEQAPFLLFFLRGMGRNEVIGRLRAHWGLPPGEENEQDDSEKLVNDYPLDTFYTMRGVLPDVEGTPPPPEGIKVIRRLGFPPFFPTGDRTVQQTLENLYEE